MSQDSPKIVIVNAWHDDNKGDCGIYEGILTLINEHWPKAQLGIVSMVSADSPVFGNAHRHLMRRFPGLEVTPSPVTFYQALESGGRYTGVLTQFLPVLLRLLPTFGQDESSIRLISQADLVIVSGGHYIFTHRNSLRSLGRLFRILYPVLAAYTRGIPYVFFAQSIGPLDDPLSDRLIRFVCNQSQGVWTREELSRQNILTIGVKESKTAVIPDAAFALQPTKSQQVEHLLVKHDLKSSRFWVVTVRNSPSGSDEERRTKTERFLDEMAALIRKVLRSNMAGKVALVVHTQGPSAFENDRFPTQNLARQLEGESVVVIDEDLCPSELAELYSHADFLIGTRFHSVIFAAVGGTPIYAISYSGPKAWGIMKMLGMQDLCADLETFTAERAFAAINAVDRKTRIALLKKQVTVFRDELRAAAKNLTEKFRNHPTNLEPAATGCSELEEVSGKKV